MRWFFGVFLRWGVDGAVSASRWSSTRYLDVERSGVYEHAAELGLAPAEFGAESPVAGSRRSRVDAARTRTGDLWHVRFETWGGGENRRGKWNCGTFSSTVASPRPASLESPLRASWSVRSAANSRLFASPRPETPIEGIAR